MGGVRVDGASDLLPGRRAAVIAGRDLRSAPGKFVFVVLSVAVGVAALWWG
jgi:putative ABC transport system permease protein